MSKQKRLNSDNSYYIRLSNKMDPYTKNNKKLTSLFDCNENTLQILTFFTFKYRFTSLRNKTV